LRSKGKKDTSGGDSKREEEEEATTRNYTRKSRQVHVHECIGVTETGCREALPANDKKAAREKARDDESIHTYSTRQVQWEKSKERNLGTNVQKGKDAYKQRVRRRKMEVREGWRRADKKQGFSRVTNSPQQTHGIFGRRTTISYYSITGSTALYWRHSSVRMND
jgi:hypothetical protein